MCPSLNPPATADPWQLKILIVDDEPTLRLSFAYALMSHSTLVETAANGQHALEQLSKTVFDAVILDLRMPDLDGIHVIEALRDSGNRVPIILCSAALTPSAMLRAIHCGVVDFLNKPVHPAELRQALEFLLQPQPEPFSQAMQAARQMEPATAIQILTDEPQTYPTAEHWLSIFLMIQGGTTLARVEEWIRLHGRTLAFHAQ